jgi:Peptidase A4 family
MRMLALAIISFFMLQMVASIQEFASAQIAAPTDAETVQTNIPSVKAYRALPPSFDLEGAESADLARYGLPPRPDRAKFPKAYAVWETLAKAAKLRVTPELRETNVYNGPITVPPVGKPHAAGQPTYTTDDAWSGFVINDLANPFNPIARAAGDTPSTVVTGRFIVPYARSSNCSRGGGSYYSAIWVGIDGFGTPDVFQAGASANLDCPAGTGVVLYSWIEWYPQASIMVSQPTISPGDVIDVAVIAYVINNAPNYILTITNEDESNSYSFPMSPPSGYSLIGNSIEWIVERPTVNKSLTNLTDYDIIGWNQMTASVSAGNGTATVGYQPSSAPSGASYEIGMTDGTSVISRPELDTNGGLTWDPAWFYSQTPY